ncbi:MAG: helix-turn-helix transcriptional regulator [Clostridia bacterium]|nr:helix-turn-helix transcriptional regulator [Clostridia bacterium]
MISRKFDGNSNVCGKEIEKLRKQKHWSRATLSNKLMMLGIDINYDGIYKIENERRIVKDFELAAIAKVLNTSENDLLFNFKNKL